MTDLFFKGDYTAAPVDYRVILLSLILAFSCGNVIAWVYMGTHSGLSYSRSFVNSLIVMPVIVALVLMVLSNNLVNAFGLMAVLAIVRFRNVVRDTLDTTFVLAVIVIGVACGTQRFATAVLGCAVVSAIIVYLSFTSFGIRNRYGIIVNIQWDRAIGELGDLARLLRRHSQRTHCASQRAHDGQKGADLSYRLLLRDPSRSEEMLSELRAFPGVARVTSIIAEDESEI